MANSSNWRDVLKSQYSDLDKLEEMDKELNDLGINASIDKMLKKPTSFRVSKNGPLVDSGKNSSLPSSDYEIEPEPAPLPIPTAFEDIPSSVRNFRSTNETNLSSPRNILDGDELQPLQSPTKSKKDPVVMEESPLPKAPENQIRYFRAKVKMLEQQLEGMNENKRQMNDQIAELNSKLKTEKEDNKLLKKR